MNKVQKIAKRILAYNDVIKSSPFFLTRRGPLTLQMVNSTTTLNNQAASSYKGYDIHHHGPVTDSKYCFRC